MIGKTVSHYKITRQLGAGGMGVVYEAVDTRLNRTVALKFLPPESTRDREARVRFTREAQAASALDHPNVCTVYEIGETDDGQLFLAMACYEGETLKERIAKGPLPLDEALDITRQMAEGLAKAHERDIVHRDIKPANIFVTTDGLVKILDFGLAKLAGQTRLTREGTTLGTVSYMSPELAGGKEADRRTDLWCLGVVLYEMVTGRLPFQGENQQAVIHGIQTQEPEPVTGLRTGVPLELERITGKCMAKDAAERYQHADDLLADLRRLERESSTSIPTTPGTKRRWPWVCGFAVAAIIAGFLVIKNTGGESPETDSEIPMLAVLPFENLGDPADAYFADGITEEILTKLSSIPELGVIARESSFQFRGEGFTLEEIGNRLGVDYVIKGTIRWQAMEDGSNRIRVTPRLIALKDQRNVWAEAYEEDLDQIFRVQAKIGEEIAKALNIRLLESSRRAWHERPTESLEAYESFLRAREFILASPTRENFEAAEGLLLKAIELDPEFAAAYAWHSQLCSEFHHWVVDRTAERLDMARSAFERALSLDPYLPEAHLAKGLYFYFGHRDYEEAQAALMTAHELQPNGWRPVHYLGVTKKRQGLFEEALGWYRKAHAINPVSFKPLVEEAVVLEALRRDDEMEETLLKTISLWPDEPSPYRNLSMFYRNMDGSTDRAKPIMEVGAQRYGAQANRGEWFRIHVLDREFEKALGAADEYPQDEAGQLNKHLEQMELHYYLHDPRRMRASADSARIILERKTSSEPEDHGWRAWLGLAYAYLGRKDEGVREAKMAVSLLPTSKDAIVGPLLIEDLAMVYLLNGDHGSAIRQLEIVLQETHFRRVPYIRSHPFWDALHADSRFQALLEKYDEE